MSTYDPHAERFFQLKRFTKTTLRGLHILGVVGAGGGILLQVADKQWLNYWIMAMVTGCLLMLWEIVRDWRWLIQMKGVLTLVKLGILMCFTIIPEYKPALVTIIILLSVFVTHGPSSLRHYSIIHRRQIHSKEEIKG
ncbi:hypothetical protein [Shewanella dokdonensis]|uniref:Uncharacterized protein n=1 Tax=Shewanella dokdonensis TaxID=712036 RepID=A0ABX8DDT5_9GAMM|nr:hypothetical protein [Shewanella dokdonensis]MCL1074630.1 hypothetical protein [Shewanella dokdonensis]QVK22371.1 hypothetical protein KHX94_13335 [Shewanella dokdonensis]